MDIKTLYSPITEPLAQTEEYLRQFERSLHNVIPHKQKKVKFLIKQGKKLRAAMFLFSAGKAAKSKDAQKVATILELLHYASLVHDDILDQESIRRGYAPLYQQINLGKALLLGDYIFAQALKFLPRQQYEKVMRTLVSLVSEMCLGEFAQIRAKHKHSFNKKQYFQKIENKTAMFFAKTCFLGSLFNAQVNGSSAVYEQFGNNFGLAFQILDDSLEIAADLRGQKGKNLLFDIQQGNLTLPYLLLLEKAGSDEKQKIKMLFKQAGQSKSAVVKLHKMIKQRDILTEVYTIMEGYLKKADFVLKILTDKKSKENLENMSVFILAYARKSFNLKN